MQRYKARYLTTTISFTRFLSSTRCTSFPGAVRTAASQLTRSKKPALIGCIMETDRSLSSLCRHLFLRQNIQINTKVCGDSSRSQFEFSDTLESGKWFRTARYHFILQ